MEKVWEKSTWFWLKKKKRKKETSVPPNVGNYKTKLIFKILFS